MRLNHNSSKDRLLDEAENLFAQKGFDAVSIREITNAAKCNLASVNYHFGNKQNLYLEVFRSRCVPRAKRIQEKFRNQLVSEENHTPQSVIQALAHAFIEGPLSDEERRRHQRLMALEMGQPTQALAIMAKEIIRPFVQELKGVLQPFMVDSIDEKSLMLKIMSMMIMILHFSFARPAVTLITKQEYTPEFRKLLVRHITGFCIKGLGLTEKEDFDHD